MPRIAWRLVHLYEQTKHQSSARWEPSIEIVGFPHACEMKLLTASTWQWTVAAVRQTDDCDDIIQIKLFKVTLCERHWKELAFLYLQKIHYKNHHPPVDAWRLCNFMSLYILPWNFRQMRVVQHLQFCMQQCKQVTQIYFSSWFHRRSLLTNLCSLGRWYFSFPFPENLLLHP